MGSLSPLHWMLIVLLFPLPLVMWMPAVKRTGHSRWWVLLCFVPWLGLLALWLLAFTRWPAQPER